MNVICVDNNPRDLKNLLRQVRGLVHGASVHGCRSPEEAILVAERESCDVLMTPTDLNRIHTDGFMLAEKIQKYNPRVNIIFLTEHADHREALKAFQIYASGYLVKPYTLGQLAEEFAHLKNPVEDEDIDWWLDTEELEPSKLQMVSGGLPVAAYGITDDLATNRKRQSGGN